MDGHRSVSTVYDCYVHLFPGGKDPVIDSVDAARSKDREWWRTPDHERTERWAVAAERLERHSSALSLHHPGRKESLMEIAARMSSKGQVTVPKAVREALGLGEGDDVLFRVEGDRAVLARTPEFLSLAGTISVPAAKRNVAWDEVIRSTRAKRAATAR